MSTRTASTAHNAAMTAQIATYTASAAAASASDDGYPDGREHGEQHDVEGAAAGARAGDGARDGRSLRGDLRRDLVDRAQVCHRFGFGKTVFHAVAYGLVVERERLLDFGVRELAQRPLQLGEEFLLGHRCAPRFTKS